MAWIKVFRRVYVKKRVFLVISLILALIIILISAIIYKQKYKFTVPSMENINTIKIAPAKTGGGQREELVLDKNKKEHLDMINNILNWLKYAKVMSINKGDITYHGGTPTYLIIELKDGSKIQLQSSVDAIATKIPNGTEIRSQDVSGQVTLYFSNKRNPIRVLSPQLKSFINDGWKSF